MGWNWGCCDDLLDIFGQWISNPKIPDVKHTSKSSDSGNHELGLTVTKPGGNIHSERKKHWATPGDLQQPHPIHIENGCLLSTA
jgi:hypothetical protein